MSEPRENVILIIEDELLIIEFLKFAVEKDGFRTVVAENGVQAMKLIEMSPPQLILLDMMLPGKGGYEIIRLLQADEYKDIPIIVMTGRVIDESFKNSIKSEPNVREFVTKPINLPVLMGTIHSTLKTMSPEEKRAQEKHPGFNDGIDPWKMNF